MPCWVETMDRYPYRYLFRYPLPRCRLERVDWHHRTSGTGLQYARADDLWEMVCGPEIARTVHCVHYWQRWQWWYCPLPVV